MSGLHHLDPAGDVIMPVLKIIAGKSVHYSLNNGITILEYEDGELYDVPPFAAEGMIARGWAKLAAPDPREPGREGDDPGRPHPQHQPQPSPAPERDQPPVKEPGHDDGGGEEHHDDERRESGTLRARSKRR